MEIATVSSLIEVLQKYQDNVGDVGVMFLKTDGKTLYAPVGTGLLGNGKNEDSIVILLFDSTEMNIPDEIHRETVDSQDTVLGTVDELLTKKDEIFNGRKTD